MNKRGRGFYLAHNRNSYTKSGTRPTRRNCRVLEKFRTTRLIFGVHQFRKCYPRPVMKIQLAALPIILFSLSLSHSTLVAQSSAAAPHLEKRGAATQLIVDGAPFLMLSGELHNSSSSSLEYMKPIWPQLKAMGLNSVVTPLGTERGQSRRKGQLRLRAS